MESETKLVQGYEQEFERLNTSKEKFDFLIFVLDEYTGQASMALDITAQWEEEDENAFGEMGVFIFEKMKSLREELFD